MFELFAQIIAEQGGAGDRGGVDSGLIQPGKGPRWRRRRSFWVIFDAELGVGEGTVIAVFGIRANPSHGIFRQRFS